MRGQLDAFMLSYAFNNDSSHENYKTVWSSQLYTYMTRNARWRSRRPRYKAAVHVPDFDTLVPAPELSLPIQLCRHISKGIIFCIRERQLWSGNECVKIRYVNGSFVAGTSALTPGVPRHMCVFIWNISACHPNVKHANTGCISD